LTESGRVAAAWVEFDTRTAGMVSLRAAWTDAKGRVQPAHDVDAFTLPPSYARLSVRAGTNLVLAADAGRLAIAWRPLLPPPGQVADTGDSHHPPSVPFAAAVRIIEIFPDETPRLVSQHRTTVHPLMATTGIGPWSLDPGGAWTFALDGRAVFLWLDPVSATESRLVAARVRDPTPTVLVQDSFQTLWVPSAGSTTSRVVLNAYRAAPDFRRFEVRCIEGR
jgi:hypothetical protein